MENLRKVTLEKNPATVAIRTELAALRVPDEFATNGPLKEVLSVGEFQKDFRSYYKRQLKRIEEEGDTVEMNPQEAFEEAVGFFCRKVDTVIETVDARHGRPVFSLDDVDELFGRVPHTNKKIRVPGFEDVEEDDLPKPQMEELRQLRLQDAYARFELNPGNIYAIKYLDEKYGSLVTQGILTTKEQFGLDTYLQPILDDVLPGIFHPDFVMSSKDGAAEKLIPKVIEMMKKINKRKKDEREKKANDAETSSEIPETKMDTKPFTFADALALEGFLDESPEVRAVIAERVVMVHDQELTDYDTKILMMIRMLERARKAGAAKMREELPPEDHHPEEYHDEWHANIHPTDVAIILFDDAEQPAVIPHDGPQPFDSSLKYVVMPRFRLPDDIY